MPAALTKHQQLRADFRVAINDAIVLNQRLEDIIAEKPGVPDTGYHGKVSHSPPPWNSPAANAITDLHAWTRKNERFMASMLNLPERVRGGSSDNTEVCLRRLESLAEASTNDIVAMLKRELNTWCRQAGIVLGETEAAKRLPRMKGESEPRCPWCKHDTLRQLARDGKIFCIDITCIDEEGRRPSATLEYFQGDMVLRWQDGVLS